MNLFLKALLSSIDELAKAKGIRSFRVDYKRNRRGELVIALMTAQPREHPVITGERPRVLLLEPGRRCRAE